jgi:broad specificity phosphatase PhoE
MQRRDFLLTAAALALPAKADPGDTQLALWRALRSGGIAILFRHAATEPGVGDPPGYQIGDCASQRNLSAEGRAQATRIGVAFAEQGVQVSSVLSSEWCRCVETARLAFPQLAVEVASAFSSFFDNRQNESARTSAARSRIAAVRAPANMAVVTHQVNIAALTGQLVGSGEAVLVRASGKSLEQLGRLLVS